MKKDAKIKVLQVTSGFRKGVSGGIPSVLFNYCTAPTFDDNEVGFDYLSLGYQTFEPYRSALENNGGKLLCLDIHSTGMKRNIQIFTRLHRFLIKNKNTYDIIHINSGALLQVLSSAMAARCAGIKKIIIHSHNAVVKKKKTEIIHNILKPFFYLCVDEYYACSELAAVSMFPQKVLKDKKWKLIPNAVEINKYSYNEEVRNQYRQDLGWSDKTVIGHVGRFNEQKNHEFLIEVFSEVAKRRADTVLLLIGTGNLKKNIENRVRELGLENRVVFTGQRTDVECLMQAMDVFVLPSLYEGFPVVSIELQAAGLKAMLSDAITKETNITECISYYSLVNKEKWIDALTELNKNYVRKSYTKEIIKAGYELHNAAQRYKELLIKCK